MSPLRISKCTECSTTAWPVRPHCSRCLGQMREADASDEGRIIECSQKDGSYFCMAEFDGVRLLCRLDSKSPPRAGQKARFLGHEKAGQAHSFIIEPV